jgi:hypothetical protein
MSARRDELIQLAAETLGCVGQTAHGHWIYRDEPTGLWMVSDDAMAQLGERLGRWDPVTAWHAWCRETPATEVDVGLLVRDYAIQSGDDMDATMAQALVSHRSWSVHGVHPRTAMHYLQIHLLLRFYRDDVVDTIRINEEIDRDREWHVEESLGMHEPADDCEADR